MNLKDFVKDQYITKKTLQLTDDISVDVNLRPMPFYLFWKGADEHGNELTDDQLIAHRIAHCVVDDEGNPVFTYEQIIGKDPNLTLDPLLILKLGELLADSSTLGKMLKTSSDSKKSSGASLSSTELAEEQ